MLFSKKPLGMIICEKDTSYNLGSDAQVSTNFVVVDEQHSLTDHSQSVKDFYLNLQDKYYGIFITEMPDYINPNKAKYSRQYAVTNRWKTAGDGRYLLFEKPDGSHITSGRFSASSKLRRTVGLDSLFQADIDLLDSLIIDECNYLRETDLYMRLKESRLLKNVSDSFNYFLENGLKIGAETYIEFGRPERDIILTYDQTKWFEIDNHKSFRIHAYDGTFVHEDGQDYYSHVTIADFGNRALTRQELSAFACILCDMFPLYFCCCWDTYLIFDPQEDHNLPHLYLRSNLIPKINVSSLSTASTPEVKDDGIY